MKINKLHAGLAVLAFGVMGSAMPFSAQAFDFYAGNTTDSPIYVTYSIPSYADQEGHLCTTNLLGNMMTDSGWSGRTKIDSHSYGQGYNASNRDGFARGYIPAECSPDAVTYTAYKADGSAICTDTIPFGAGQPAEGLLVSPLGCFTSGDVRDLLKDLL